jgi:hypothetical protein
MTVKSATKKFGRTLATNKFTAPVAKTVAVPVLAVAYPFILVHQLNQEYKH